MLEKMNTKRWIALAIAVLIIGISALSTGLSTKINREERLKKMEQTLKSSMGNLDQMGESVLEAGDATSRIAVIEVDGAIMNLPQSNLFYGGYNHGSTLEALDRILEDDTVKGVLLKVNSPGGGVYESAELHKKIDALSEKNKQLFVSMGNMAASGGYYISAPADRIYASPSTITGSIGVIMGGNNVSGLLDKLGIVDQSIKSAPHKDIGSSTRPMTDDERAILQGVIDDMYGEFLNVVSTGRNMPMDQLRPLADGSIFTGNQAKANGLVDELGDSEDALAALKESLKTEEPEVFEYDTSFSDSVFSKLFSQKTSDKEVAAKILLEAFTDASRPMYLYGGV